MSSSLKMKNEKRVKIESDDEMCVLRNAFSLNFSSSYQLCNDDEIYQMKIMHIERINATIKYAQ